MSDELVLSCLASSPRLQIPPWPPSSLPKPPPAALSPIAFPSPRNRRPVRFVDILDLYLSDRLEESTEWAEQSEQADQTDGATGTLGGSDLHEPDYTVEVKLSDLQADPNNPLYSVKNFEDLGLYVSEHLESLRIGL